jgi:lipoprotein-anchoring transpeptidase ErfK/SrfK
MNMKFLINLKSIAWSIVIGFSIVPGYALAEKAVIFDPQVHRWYAVEDGEVVKSGIASGGADYCADTHRRCHTPVGVFRIQNKEGAGCKSSIYPLGRGGAPMPFCMHFTKYYAIHGSYELSATRNISHGCIRIEPSAARWLNENFAQIGTKVVVKPY